jgi:hypothetical protein
MGIARCPQPGTVPIFAGTIGHRPGTDAKRWSAMVGMVAKMGLSPFGGAKASGDRFPFPL